MIFLSAQFLKWLPFGFYCFCLALAAAIIFVPKFSAETKRRMLKILFFAAAVFSVLVALLKTYAQQRLWLSQPMAKFLITLPVDQNTPKDWPLKLWPALTKMQGGYFIYYCFYHFWLPALVSVICAIFFYYFLLLLKKYREEIISSLDAWLGALGMVICGWPALVMFIPIAFILALVVSVFRNLSLKKNSISLLWPFLLAIAIVLIWGSNLSLILHLEKLAF